MTIEPTQELLAQHESDKNFDFSLFSGRLCYRFKLSIVKGRTRNFLRFGECLQTIFDGKLYEKLKSIPLIHCAGTKVCFWSISQFHGNNFQGKGTTCAMAEMLLRSRGYKTGLFTSPHFNNINERVRINGKPISEEQLSATFEKLEKAEETEYLRCGNEWFSYLTLIALQTFAEQKVDVIILEVGVGGQLCATSQYPIGAPRVCCISGL